MKHTSISGVVETSADFGTEVLLAIQPVYAERIFDGSKRYELRRVCPRNIPRKIYLWVTGKEGGVVGYAVVSRMIWGDPTSVWRKVGDKAASRDRFFRYFAGEKAAYAFEIESVLRFSRILKLDEIRTYWDSASIPRNFVYVDPETPLGRCLAEKSFNDAVKETGGGAGVGVRHIQKKEYGKFRAAVSKHIGESYLETGAEYADQIIEAHEKGYDSEGVFTTFKRVCAIEGNRKTLGFVVLTGKLGGSIKTGPTIIDDQNRGTGSELRKVIHDVASRLGYKKVYCTAPATKASAILYLVKAGYRIEADLDRQYHDKHRELVFGWNLDEESPCCERIERSVSVYERITRVRGSNEIAGLSSWLQEHFSDAYCKVSHAWATRQLQKCANKESTSGYGKPVWCYRADDQDGLAALVLCVWKRGGSVKLCPVILRGSDGSVAQVLEYSIRGVRRNRVSQVRKLYCHVRLEDEQLVRLLRKMNFQIEGCLRRPYKDGQDMLALSVMQ